MVRSVQVYRPNSCSWERGGGNRETTDSRCQTSVSGLACSCLMSQLWGPLWELIFTIFTLRHLERDMREVNVKSPSEGCLSKSVKKRTVLELWRIKARWLNMNMPFSGHTDPAFGSSLGVNMLLLRHVWTYRPAAQLAQGLGCARDRLSWRRCSWVSNIGE